MAKKQTKKMLALNLDDIVAAGENGIHVPQPTAESFYNEGLIDVDPNNIDEYDCILVRATQKGIDFLNETQDETGEMSMTTEFVIETGIELPPKRSARTGSKYPFDDLPEGGSFLVPGDDPDAVVRRLGGAVAKANRAHSVGTGQYKESRGKQVEIREQTRKFVVRAVEGGARVFRTL